jgi:UDPglucose--hexose-1-phosphate uridylyltransferase
VQIVINHGRAAGASIEHPHAQLVALDLMPPAVLKAVERFEAASRDLVVADLEDAGDALRVVEGPVAAWCPQASSAPYELRIALLAPGGRFDEADDSDMDGVAAVAGNALGRLASVLGDVPYNLVVHTAGPGTSAGSFHWYIEVQTRINVVAGFEQGTGILVNTMPPELAAPQLRADRR